MTTLPPSRLIPENGFTALKKAVCLFSFLFLFFDNLSGQSFCGQPAAPCNLSVNPGCNVEDLCDPMYQSLDNKGPYFLRVFVHVINDDFGQGGQTLEQIKEGFEFLDRAFNPHNIYFVWDCAIDPINDTNLFNDVDGTTAVFNENPHSTGIDIYLFPDHTNPPAGQGFARCIPETAFYTSGNSANNPFLPQVRSFTIAHEMAHCLGLMHTFETAFGLEEVDGDDCHTDGDCVCDTPAEPVTNETPWPLCNYTGSILDPDGNSYNRQKQTLCPFPIRHVGKDLPFNKAEGCGI